MLYGGAHVLNHYKLNLRDLLAIPMKFISEWT